MKQLNFDRNTETQQVFFECLNWWNLVAGGQAAWNFLLVKFNYIVMFHKKFRIILLANIEFQQVTSIFSKLIDKIHKNEKFECSSKKEGVLCARIKNHTKLQKLSLKRISQNNELLILCCELMFFFGFYKHWLFILSTLVKMYSIGQF